MLLIIGLRYIRKINYLVTEAKMKDCKLSRRKFLKYSGAVGATLLAGTGLTGCLQENKPSQTTKTLKAGGSSTVYPIASDAQGVWQANPPADDEEYWGPGQYGIDTDKNLADYWSGLYGFEEPFSITIALSHSGTGLTNLKDGLLDIADASAPVTAELDLSQSGYDKFEDHVVGFDGQPIVVSREVYEHGIDKLTLDQVAEIYGEGSDINNWEQLGGPDKEIQVVGRASGSGTDTSFRKNVLGDPKADMRSDIVRKGQNQQVQTLVGNSDNAIAYCAINFVLQDGRVPSIGLETEDTIYAIESIQDRFSDSNKKVMGLGASEYPLSRELHMYTYEGTDDREAAFLRMILSEFGQENFVKPNDYFKLSEERRKEEIDKLASPKQ
ncbi:MAG: ABC-type phosphate transport system periplasmic component [Candidatus Methanohalarchaeum thermophilum]|uniref:ABC-type phosphate transport system periplasmic component n=1 Tax=Methanohalarchaeum thermophilum TaxID=1903181 RepID=A0A1Q6DTF7_METT1|nr:MAG: ABC-type phosphate transport system periplasmic component [Candidatus Methanohalarchaeum thermophilum]